MTELNFENIIGKVMLVGFTYVKPNGEVAGRRQFWGRVEEVDARGIYLRHPSGARHAVPPDLRSTSAAAPGTYRLHSTGEEIENPDLLSTWTVRAPEE